MRRLLVLCLMLFPPVFSPVTATAQQGTIAFDLSVQFDYDLLPPENARLRDQIPAQSFTSLVLLFDGSESLMKDAPTAEEVNTDGLERNARLEGYVARLRMGSASRSDHETLVEAYVNYESGTVADAREFMGRDFLITGEQPTYAWRLTGEQSELLGFNVQKATALKDGTAIEAWFTPEIPVSGGPGVYGGLPGMILVVSVDDGQRVYSATDVNLDPVEDGVIRPPEEGSKVSRDEYEEIVAEKLAEIREVGRVPATDVRRDVDFRRTTDTDRRRDN